MICGSKSHFACHHEHGNSKSTYKVYLNDCMPNSVNGIQSNVSVFSLVRIVISEMDFIKSRDEDETANLIWNDSAVQHEKIAELRNYQVHCMATMSSQHTLYGSLEVTEESLRIRVSDPIAALNRKIWVFTFIVRSNKAAQWPAAKDHDTDKLPVDVCNWKF